MWGSARAPASPIRAYKATAKVTHFSTFVLFAAPEVTPTPTPRPRWRIPGFEAVFAIVGLLAVAYLFREKKYVRDSENYVHLKRRGSEPERGLIRVIKRLLKKD
jgi:PGF-CTERM protein